MPLMTEHCFYLRVAGGVYIYNNNNNFITGLGYNNDEQYNNMNMVL